MNQFSRSCAPNRVRELAALAQALITLGSGMLRLSSSLLTPDSGKSGRCSPPQTRTEPAREKGKKNRVYGIINQLLLSCASR